MNSPNTDPIILSASGKAYHPFRGVIEEFSWSDIQHHLAYNCPFGGMCRAGYPLGQHALLASLMFDSPIYQMGSILYIAADSFLGYIPEAIAVRIPKEVHDKMDAGRSNVLRSMLHSFNIELNAEEIAGIRTRVEFARNAAYAVRVLEHIAHPCHSDEMIQFYNYACERVLLWRQRNAGGAAAMVIRNRTGLSFADTQLLFNYTSLSPETISLMLGMRYEKLKQEVVVHPERTDNFGFFEPDFPNPNPKPSHQVF